MEYSLWFLILGIVMLVAFARGTYIALGKGRRALLYILVFMGGWWLSLILCIVAMPVWWVWVGLLLGCPLVGILLALLIGRNTKFSYEQDRELAA